MPRNRNVQLDVENEDNQVYQKIEGRMIAKKRKKRNKRLKIWFRRIIILLFVLALGIGGYWFDQSSVSRLSLISVGGNTIYTQEEILAYAKLSLNSRRLLILPFLKERQMQDLSGIKSVQIHNHVLSGVVNILVEEERAVAYTKDESALTVYFETGESAQFALSRESALLDVPYMSGFDDPAVIAGIVSELAKLSSDVLLSISQIQRVSLYSDDNMIYFYMDDGRIVISSQFGITALKDYQAMVSKDTTNKKCWIVLEMSEANQIAVLPTNCPGE